MTRIATKYGVNVRSVWHALVNLNIQRRPPGVPRGTLRPSRRRSAIWPQEEVARLYAAYRDQRLTLDQVGRLASVDKMTISRLFRCFGYAVPKAGRRTKEAIYS
jgi:hypothetical protein